jgi:hypothetical protein
MGGFSFGLLVQSSELTRVTSGYGDDIAMARNDHNAAKELPLYHTENGFRNSYGEDKPHKGLWSYLRMKYFEAT